MQWLSDGWTLLSSALPLVPWLAVALGIFLGFITGLCIGLVVTTLLHRAGLLRRRNPWLNGLVKLHWLFIPGLLALSGAQIGLVQGVWKAADAIIVSQQGAIQGLTQQLLGDLQTQIGKMIEQNPSVTDVSLNDIVEVALAQAVFKITPDPQSSATINPTYVFALNWFARAVGSSKLHDALHEAIVTTVQDYTGADKKTVELALSTTMQQLADGNMFYDFSRTQLRRARSSLVKGVLALTFVLLLIPGLEISISKWRRW